MNLHVFTHQKNITSDDSHDFFQYLFRHWFGMICGIGFASILAPLWFQIPCFFRNRFLLISGMLFLLIFIKNDSFPFWLLFRTLTVPVPQGVFWDVPWLTLAPFWFPLTVFVPSRLHLGIASRPFRHPHLQSVRRKTATPHQGHVRNLAAGTWSAPGPKAPRACLACDVVPCQQVFFFSRFPP